MTLLPRQSGQFIMEHAEHVHIDDKALENLAHFVSIVVHIFESKWRNDISTSSWLLKPMFKSMILPSGSRTTNCIHNQ